MVNIALVGCGGMAHTHAKQLKQIANLHVVALCDVLKDRTATFKHDYFNDAAEYESFDEMLRSLKGKLDAVVLVTPHAVHYPHVMAALRQGLHVLVEKPMVTNSEHAYELWRAVKESGKLLGIAFQSPHTAEFGYLAAQRDAGKLGKVQNISGYVSQGWCKGTRGKWRQDPKISGGGYIYDTGAHLLNAMMWLMNEPVVEVCCMMDNVDTPVDILGTASLRFQSGTLGSVTMAGNTPLFRSEIQIMTDKLGIITDQYGAKLEFLEGGKRHYPHVPSEDHPAAGTPHLNFLNAILGREPLRAPVRYGVLLSALMDAMYESNAKRKPVAVKPVPTDI